MDHIVLGLLMLKSMTIYELNQAFGQGLSTIYAASYGNLQYAVKKLIANEMITYEERVENGRNKKIYKINEKGIEAFFKWMMGVIDPKHIETLMLAKIYFMGLIESDDDKRQIIDNILESAHEYYKWLYEITKHMDRSEIPPEDQGIAKFQLMTLDYSIGEYEYTIEWLKKLRNEI